MFFPYKCIQQHKMSSDELVMLKHACLNDIFMCLYRSFCDVLKVYYVEQNPVKKAQFLEELAVMRHHLLREYERLHSIWKIIDRKWNGAIRRDISNMCVHTLYGLDFGENLDVSNTLSSTPKSRLDIRILAVYDIITKFTVSY